MTAVGLGERDSSKAEQKQKTQRPPGPALPQAILPREWELLALGPRLGEGGPLLLWDFVTSC